MNILVHFYMIKKFKLNGKYVCHVGLIKMKKKIYPATKCIL